MSTGRPDERWWIGRKVQSARTFSDLILELYGREVGEHARMAVGMAALPLNTCVTIAAEVAIKD